MATMVSALILATLAAVFYSLWIRRDTWRSRWEAGASLNIALQGCAVLLMSPWASAKLARRCTTSSGAGMWRISSATCA
ncbi:gp56 domain protein [Mycobacterium xenopi 3993]|nr:gp56 domain protein [Mycobacterium xenopi 3993]